MPFIALASDFSLVIFVGFHQGEIAGQGDERHDGRNADDFDQGDEEGKEKKEKKKLFVPLGKEGAKLLKKNQRYNAFFS